MITGYDHVQVAIRKDGEDVARSFYCALLGMREVAKPPARKARPAFVVDDLDALGATLAAAGHDCVPSDEVPGVRRFHTVDPFGNRREFQQA